MEARSRAITKISLAKTVYHYQRLIRTHYDVVPLQLVKVTFNCCEIRIWRDIVLSAYFRRQWLEVKQRATTLAECGSVELEVVEQICRLEPVSCEGLVTAYGRQMTIYSQEV